MTPPDSAGLHSHAFRRSWAVWFTLLVLALVAGVRIALMNFPLERDEGEYAYAGQLLLQGIPPYQLAYNMKFPGTYAAYAVIMWLFGETPAGIHFGVMVATTLTSLMLYRLGRRILDPVTGMVAATTYAVLATESGMFGMAGHATHFAALFATAGGCALWRARPRADWLWAGIAGAMFGVAVLMKQHAVFLGAWALLVLAWDCRGGGEVSRRRRVLNFAAAGVGLALPIGICGLWLWHANVFGKFWFWTVDYARRYVEIKPFSSSWRALKFSLRQIMLREDYLLWALVVAGAGLIWLEERLRPARLWLLGFAAAGLMTTVPGFYFRTHYFLLALPAAALLAAGAVAGLRRLWNKLIGPGRFQNWPVVVLYAALLALTLWQNRGVWSLFARAEGREPFQAHLFYGPEPFPEAAAVADFIRAHSDPEARIAVLGSEPEIYFLAHRHSATGYIYTYALMEAQPFARQMQAEMIREIETNTPEFIVYTSAVSSWLPTPGSKPDIFDWWADYKTNYTRVGVADILWPSETRFAWGESAASYGALKGEGFEVYRRNERPDAANAGWRTK